MRRFLRRRKKKPERETNETHARCKDIYRFNEQNFPEREMV